MSRKILIMIFMFACLATGNFFGVIISSSYAPSANNIRCAWSDIVSQIDYWDPTVRSFALSAIKPEHGGEYNLAQVFDIWDAINNNWVYVNDPQGNKYKRQYQFTKASETISHYHFRGDCDDFAIVVAASIHAIGGQAHVRVEKDVARNIGHAYPLVYIGNNKKEVSNYIRHRYGLTTNQYIWGLKGDNGWWLNLDWNTSYPGGHFWVCNENRKILADVRP